MKGSVLITNFIQVNISIFMQCLHCYICACYSVESKKDFGFHIKKVIASNMHRVTHSTKL